MKRFRRFWINSLILVSIMALFGCTNKPFPSLIETYPMLVQRQYTTAEKKKILRSFETNPATHSQEYGNLLLNQMHQLSPLFAEEFSQIPEIYDGINVNEAKVMSDIYKLTKTLDLRPSLINSDEKIYWPMKIQLEWTSEIDASNWRGTFTNAGNASGVTDALVYLVSPIGFDSEDKIDMDDFNKNKGLRWWATTDKGETDGLNIEMGCKFYKPLMLEVNDQHIVFRLADLLHEDLVFDSKHGLRGTLIIKVLLPISWSNYAANKKWTSSG